jgi:serine/threonine protein kinase
MENRSALKRCPVCSAEIPVEAPQGLCPRCLLSEVSVPTSAGAKASTRPVPPSIDAVAAAFPQLEILGLIGQGGMGFVFKARQPKLERFVALKLLPETLAADPAFAERFSREGRVLARLSHPNIVTVHDFGQASGFFFLLMEYVDGVNLRQAMKAGRFTPDQALAVVPRICDALEFAHNEGVLHRDIKPENILLDGKGRVKIADFGIAKIIGAETGPSTESAQAAIEHTLTSVVGTPQYMAPEQLENPRQVDRRADIYSLGVVFYEMLTGELPLGRFAPPSEKSSADPRLDQVVLRALEKEPARRTPTAGEMKTQVETFAGTTQPPPLLPKETPAQQPASRKENANFRSYLRRGLAAGVVVFLLCIATALVLSLILPKTYASTARILLRVQLNGPMTYDPYFLQTEFEKLKSAHLLGRVAASLNLAARWGEKYNQGTPLSENAVVRRLQDSLEVRNSRNTGLIEVRVYSDSPNEAAEIANRIAESYLPLAPARGASFIEQATRSTRPVRPNLPLNILIGALAGVIAGVLASIVVGVLSFALRTPTEGENDRQVALRRRFALGTAALAILIVIGLLAILLRPERYTREPQTFPGAQAPNYLGSLRLIAAGPHNNIVLARTESIAPSPLHQIIARFSGPLMESNVWRQAKASVSGPVLAPSPDEQFEGLEPMESRLLWNDLTNQPSSALFQCPNECQLQFVLPSETEAQEAARQLAIVLGQPVDLLPRTHITLFEVGEYKAWLEVREYKPLPGKLAFIPYSNRSIGQPPIPLSQTGSVRCAVLSIPPDSELSLRIDSDTDARALLSTTLSSDTQNPGLYWLTWYAIDPADSPADSGKKWEIFIHDARTVRQLHRVASPATPEIQWLSSHYNESESASAGAVFSKVLFYGPTAGTKGSKLKYAAVKADLTLQRRGQTQSSVADDDPPASLPAANTATARAMTVPPSDQFSTELARLKLQHAEQSAVIAQNQHEVGRITTLELEKAIAQRDIARADLNGDAVGAARTALQIAEKEFLEAEKKFEVGMVDSSEVARSKLARDQAAVVLRQKEAESAK